MKFLLISKCGEGAHLLWLLQELGNEVNLFIEEKSYQNCWDGLLPKTTSIPKSPDKDTVIIFDMSGLGAIAERFRLNGYKVLGSSEFSDDLEHDRKFGFESMERAGIRCPLYFEFHSIEKAIDFIIANKSMRFVFKPDDAPCKLTYVSSDSEDLISYLDFVDQYYGEKIKSFILQEFIEGTIVSTELWCDGTKFLYPCNHTVEAKKFMNDDLGPSTGCSGNVVWSHRERCLICESGVALLEDECVKNKYIGPVDLNTIINDDGIFGLEWTPRFGYDALPTMLQLLPKSSLGEVFHGIANASLSKMPYLENVFAGGARLTIPPYPLEPKNYNDVQKVSPNIGLPIRGLPNKYKDNLFFYEVMEGPNGLIHSGGTGVILCASSLGDTVEESLKIPNEILAGSKIPDKQYRTDLSEVLTEMQQEVEDCECLTSKS